MSAYMASSARGTVRPRVSSMALVSRAVPWGSILRPGYLSSRSGMISSPICRLAWTGVMVAVSARASTSAACLPSIRVSVASSRFSVRRATADNGTSAYTGPSPAPGPPGPRPTGRMMRSFASSLRLRRRSAGYRTITLISSRPRWMR